MHPSEEDEPAPPPSSAQLPLKISVYQLEIPSSATTMATGKAQEQILKFHQLQNEQLEVLKALFNVESIEPPQSDVDDSSGESSTEAVVDTPGEEADNPFPPTWDIAWDNNALAQRRDEILQRLRSLRPEDDPASSDNVTSFIAKTILKDIDQLHFNRIPDPETSTILPSHKRVNLAEWSDDEAFHVRDFDQNRMIAASRARDGIERDCGGGVNFLEHLKKPRSETGARGREIDIQAITPSALATVFMCEGLNATEEVHRYMADALAIQRHLSTDTRDRFHQFGTYVWNGTPGYGDSWDGTWWTTTVSFFVVHNEQPGKDSAPLSDAGVFKSTFPAVSAEDRYIREEKFTICFSSYRRWVVKGDKITWGAPRFKTASEHGPWQLLSINAPRPRYLSREGRGNTQFVIWIVENLERIYGYWLGVLNELDRQISVPSTVMFNQKVRNEILFEDENFSNSKRYFWALQSLRVFADTIERTIEMIPRIFAYIHLLCDYSYTDEWKQAQVAGLTAKFESLRERIERKRTEIQGLSDGLFSASSVVEARLAANQNNNIRLLTLVTIAFLPISLVTAVFSMQVLPSTATLASFFVTAIVVSLVTFMIVFNLRTTDRLLFQTYGDWTRKLQESMIQDTNELWKARGHRLQQAEQFNRNQTPVSSWWYAGFVLRRNPFKAMKRPFERDVAEKTQV